MNHFPLVLQHDSMQCGVACLQMICRYYGAYYSSDDINKICHPTKEGVSLLGITQAASKLELSAISGRLTVENLINGFSSPCILHWRQNHFVVLYNINRKKRLFRIADPGKGLVTYNFEEFISAWLSYKSDEGAECGIVMLIKPTKEFKKTKKNKTNVHSISFVFTHLKTYRKQFFTVSVCLGLMATLGFILPTLTQQVVDSGISSKDIKVVWLILCGQLMLTMSNTLLDFFRRRILLAVSMKITITLASDFFHKLLKLPMAFFDTKLMGDLLQRMNDYARVQEFITTYVLSMSFSAMVFISYGVMLIFYDSRIFLTFIIGSLIYSIWIMCFMQRRKVLDYEMFEQEAVNDNKTYQFITSMQEIKLQQCEGRRCDEWTVVQQRLYQIKNKRLSLQLGQESGGIFINELKNIFVTIMSATAVINGELTLGGMLAIQFIIGQLNSPLSQVMNFIYSMQDVGISLERINEIQKLEEEDAGGNKHSEFPEYKHDIDIRKLNFKYDIHSLRYTLTDINLYIPEGKITAIVGSSGSGKSTLMKLMLGYYNTENGIIKIAGRNIEHYNLKWWRSQCGVVMQDGVIFSESIARNIAVGDGEVNEELLRMAAHIACVDKDIEALPHGYNTNVGHDGQSLSQGQKQRILIARAIYKNPKYIFLDEATNALDAKNESMIVKNLRNFYKGRTVVVVAHRLSTVKEADKIVVLDRGKIAEQGNHLSLTDKKGLYYELVKNQLELGC